uniref:Tudor domain-containing protein n=1 Tax=Parastrongyloides trichosuri TaxID=131310 RepID=A0A0N4ZV28_PARTI
MSDLSSGLNNNSLNLILQRLADISEKSDTNNVEIKRLFSQTMKNIDNIYCRLYLIEQSLNINDKVHDNKKKESRFLCGVVDTSSSCSNTKNVSEQSKEHEENNVDSNSIITNDTQFKDFKWSRCPSNIISKMNCSIDNVDIKSYTSHSDNAVKDDNCNVISKETDTNVNGDNNSEHSLINLKEEDNCLNTFDDKQDHVIPDSKSVDFETSLCKQADEEIKNHSTLDTYSDETFSVPSIPSSQDIRDSDLEDDLAIDVPEIYTKKKCEPFSVFIKNSNVPIKTKHIHEEELGKNFMVQNIHNSSNKNGTEHLGKVSKDREFSKFTNNYQEGYDKRHGNGSFSRCTERDIFSKRIGNTVNVMETVYQKRGSFQNKKYYQGCNKDSDFETSSNESQTCDNRKLISNKSYSMKKSRLRRRSALLQKRLLKSDPPLAHFTTNKVGNIYCTDNKCSKNVPLKVKYELISDEESNTTSLYFGLVSQDTYYMRVPICKRANFIKLLCDHRIKFCFYNSYSGSYCIYVLELPSEREADELFKEINAQETFNSSDTNFPQPAFCIF